MHLLRLRSLRNKLALLFFGITAAAFAVIYFVVVPQLESNLEGRRLQDLRHSAVAGRAPLEELLAGEASCAGDRPRACVAVADSTDARVTLLNWNQSFAGPQGEGRELRFYPLSDSREAERAFPRDDALARRAVLTEHSQSGFGALRRRRRSASWPSRSCTAASPPGWRSTRRTSTTWPRPWPSSASGC